MLEFILNYISVQNLMWLIVALPLAGFVINGIISLISNTYKLREPRALVVLISQLVVLLSFVGIIIVWYILYGLEEASPSVITGPLFSWKGFLNQPLEFGLKADQLSLAISFVIALVGTLAHFYSVGFLSKEKNVALYFSLFNLVFSFSLLLILSDSFFFFFVIWQVMAVVGFVFISRYFTDEQGVGYASTYYVMEAISGSALVLVMFLIWKAFLAHANINIDIFQFTSIQVGSHLVLPYADVICFALLIGVLAKSMQCPLYVWLPDATKSPLPVFNFMYAVSSLLVSTYILLRLNYLVIMSPKLLEIIAVLGGVGCLFGAGASIVQKDAKRILSYFVISQMGLAFTAIGVGAFAAAVFHVFTHAVYISSLMLGVGSVMAITGYDSVDKLGGLRKSLPVTFWTTLAGALAASGIYPLSGFFSKNGVIWEVYQRGHSVLFLCTFGAGILAAIALFRMIALIFFGRKTELKKEVRLEESSVSMLVAMVILAFASIVIGWFGVRPAFGGENYFGKWLEPGLATQMVHMIGEKGRFSELVLGVIVTLFVAHAGLVTWIIYVQKRNWPVSLAQRFSKIYRLLGRGFYLNSFYRVAVIKPLGALSEWVMWKGLDKLIINGVIIGSIGRGVGLLGEIITRFRAVVLPSYVFWVIVGLIFFVGWLMF